MLKQFLKGLSRVYETSSLVARNKGWFMKLLFGPLSKGMLLGLSVILPGVSGGTMAFILGIYHKLIEEISKFRIQEFKFLVTLSSKKRLKHFKHFLKNHDWVFLIPLFLGTFLSAFLFALFVPKWIAFRSFEFHVLIFGLVLASLYFPFKDLKKTPVSFLFLFASCGLSFYLFSFAESLEFVGLFLNEASLFFLAGFITALALVVPGLSGSYLLILLGLYSPLLQSLASGEIFVLSLFIAGLVLGFLVMVHVMKSLLKNYLEPCQASLIGFIIGSLTHLGSFFKEEIIWKERGLESLILILIAFGFVFFPRFLYKKYGK